MDSGSASDSVNPLLLPEILERLFSYFDPNHSKPSMLFDFRLVCRAWNQEANRRIRRCHQITLRGSESLQKYMQRLQENGERDFNDLRLVPFENYKLTGRNWSGHYFLDSNSSMHHFFCSSGGAGAGTGFHIRELDLSIDGWNLCDLRLFFQHVNLPRLETLRLRCPTDQELYTGFTLFPSTSPIQVRSLRSLTVSTIHNAGLNPLLVPLLVDVLEANPQLQELRMLHQRLGAIGPLKCVSTTLLRTAIILSHLHTLHLDFYLTNTQLGLLANSSRFQSLSFGVQANLNPVLLAELLRANRDTLTRLEIWFEWMASGPTPINVGLPNLPALRTVKFTNVGLRFDFFLKFCPNLQSLTLCNVDVTPMAALPFRRLLRLRELNFTVAVGGRGSDSNSNSNSSSCIEDVCYLCPNLKHLSLEGEISNSMVHLIVGNLRRLVGLKLVPHGVYFGDTAFGGECKRRKDDEDDTDTPALAPCLCLCTLPDLRYLSLENNPVLTDKLISDTLSHCTALQRLTLKGPHLTRSGLECLTQEVMDGNLNVTHLTYHARISKSMTQSANSSRTRVEEEALNFFEYVEIEEIADEDSRALNSLLLGLEQRMRAQTCSIA